MRSDGTVFTDRDIHRMLRINGVKNPEGEWFRCKVDQVKAALIAVHTGQLNEENRSFDFKMRPEQEAAVEKTAAYFKSYRRDNKFKPPHFLWDAKMRFGKTFAACQLAKKMGWCKVLVLTFKPAVQSAWEEDLKLRRDFQGWQFIKPGGPTYEEADKKKPFVCFGSFQDYLGRNSAGGIKPKNEWVHTTNWDCVFLDEYHCGAWREKAKELFETEDKKEAEFGEGQAAEFLKDRDEEIGDIMPITTDGYRSGTGPQCGRHETLICPLSFTTMLSQMPASDYFGKKGFSFLRHEFKRQYSPQHQIGICAFVGVASDLHMSCWLKLTGRTLRQNQTDRLPRLQ